LEVEGHDPVTTD